MVSLSLNSLKQIMRAMVDSPGFERVLNKVSDALKSAQLCSMSALVFSNQSYQIESVIT